MHSRDGSSLFHHVPQVRRLEWRNESMTGVWNHLEASSLPGGGGMGDDLNSGSAGIIVRTLYSQPGGECPSEQALSSPGP